MIKTKSLLPTKLLKFLGIALLVIFLFILLLAYTQMTHTLIASVGWHDMGSIGWHEVASIGWGG